MEKGGTSGRLAALFEVLGVFLAAGVLEDKLIEILARWHPGFVADPFTLLSAHTSNADLLLASKRLSVIWLLQYGSYFLLIVPLSWWRKRGRLASFGTTCGGRSWRFLLLAGAVTACLSQWPVLIHSLVDAFHPLGATAPWRQAFFDMSWRRWQFWWFAGVLSYAVVPVLEELLFRGYYQRRLAENWGDGAAILGTSCLFVFAHRQYLVPNLYNVTMVASLFCMALGLGIVFAYTRSLVPCIVAHAIINIPMTTPWQLALLAVYVIGTILCFRTGMVALREIWRGARIGACIFLAVVCALYVLASQRSHWLQTLAVALLALSIVLQLVERKRVEAFAQ